MKSDASYGAKIPETPVLVRHRSGQRNEEEKQ